ncbi:hypothetical protein [Trichococcus shcherbakoviae]|uniref:Prokaryotic membrane lipoprotein lipid attachment site profile n=1 Tax=Trichococcus shcherbakoviae subsp. psychrophilus TaxID=2585775 RepID=A0A5C5E6S8_9LACT|nr:hypothetical protein [Trichococcus shcherbakoviae]TNV68929.1 hypothetical protein FHK04_05240 [Trichococcus shcherbakoviae subsp. psychrophilus]
MNKHILKNKYLLFLTSSVFLLSACGVNETKIAADISSNIQEYNTENAIEIYDTTVEKLKDNPGALSKFENILEDSITTDMQTKYLELLKDFTKANEFYEYLNGIKKLNIKSTQFTDSWLAYYSQVEDIMSYNNLQTINVEEDPETALECIRKIDTDTEFYVGVSSRIKILEEQANAALEKEMIDNFYGVWLARYSTGAFPEELLVFRPDTFTGIFLANIANINLNERITKDTYIFEIKSTYPSQNTIKTYDNGKLTETTYKFTNSERTKMELSYISTSYSSITKETKSTLQKANLTYLGEEENLEQIFIGLQNK